MKSNDSSEAATQGEGNEQPAAVEEIVILQPPAASNPLDAVAIDRNELEALFSRSLSPMFGKARPVSETMRRMIDKGLLDEPRDD